MPISQHESSCPVHESLSAANLASAEAETEESKLPAPHLVRWPWPVVLMAHVPQQSADPSSSPEGSLLLVSPTAQGLDALEDSGHIVSSLWLLAAVSDGPGAMLGHRVEEISRLVSVAADQRVLNVLSGPEGRLAAIFDDEVFVLDTSTSWVNSGQDKSTSAASEG